MVAYPRNTATAVRRWNPTGVGRSVQTRRPTHRSAEIADGPSRWEAVMPCEFSTVEVKQLWWFLDGAIMSPFTRERLHATWGFCPRHTWAYLIAECELRLMPRGVLILY